MTKKKTTTRRRDRTPGERTTALPPTPPVGQVDDDNEEVDALPARVEPDLPHPSYAWPADKPLPGAYVMRVPQPCARCRRVKTDHGSQAVVCLGTPTGFVRRGEDSGGGGVAYMMCRVCQHRWQLPVRRV